MNVDTNERSTNMVSSIKLYGPAVLASALALTMTIGC